MKALILENAWDGYARREALRVLDSVAPDIVFLSQVFERYKASSDVTERDLSIAANGLLVTTHGDRRAIEWRLRQCVSRAAAFIRPSRGLAHSVSPLEHEVLVDRTFAKPLMELKHVGYERDYLGVLERALAIWGKGVEYHEYASYLWDIVYAYIDNLKVARTYEPLQKLERVVAQMKGREGANWLANRMSNLRRSYLAYLGKPSSIAKAIAKYNDARRYNDKEIRNSTDLFRQIQSALDTDLRRWVEGEGAYDILQHRISGSGRQQYEKLIQKTLKTQIENLLLKRGFEVELLREPQLLDDKRTDFLVRYGFSGPIVIEAKLTSNSDIQGKSIEKSASFKSMNRYMQGYGATHGVFMVFDNDSARNLSTIAKVFHGIDGVSVISFDCAAAQGDGKAKPRARAKSRTHPQPDLAPEKWRPV